MPQLKYQRPELQRYKDPVVGGCNSQTVSSAECSCDCVTTECNLVTVAVPGCSTKVLECTKCTDGLPCAL